MAWGGVTRRRAHGVAWFQPLGILNLSPYGGVLTAECEEWSACRQAGQW